jgi:ABC-2 type transport system permease protein
MKTQLNSLQDILTLVRPRVLSFKNASFFRGNRQSSLMKLLLFGGIGFAFWGGIFAVSFRVLRYFKGVEELGDLLAFKLLSMILITLMSLLIFSSILTSLSKLFLSKDLNLVHAMPVSTYQIFLARWIESTLDSSWMVVIYLLPVFLAYGIVFNADWFYYLTVGSAILSLAVIASCLSAMIVVAAVVLIPANRIRNLFVFLGLLLFILIFIAFRLLRPERLANPEVFSTALMYLSALKTPNLPYLPSTWAFDGIQAAINGSISETLFHMSLSWSCVGMMIFLMIIMADRLYLTGLSKAQTSPARLLKHKISFDKILFFLPATLKAFVVKEIKSFFRDQTQWSQIFLIGGLVLIYIFNFKALPLDKAPIKTVYLQNLLSFLNVGLASFVLIAVAGRFVYPAISNENEAFWIVKSSPISMRRFLWVKFFIYLLPLLILTEILILATNMFLNVTPFMMLLSTITIFFMVPGVVGIGIGFGAAYPNFKSENPAQSVTSFGGLLFMILCAAFVGGIVILEAGPVYNLFMAGFHQRTLSILEWVWIIGSFSLALIICMLAMILPMRFGERRLSERVI